MDRERYFTEWFKTFGGQTRLSSNDNEFEFGKFGRSTWARNSTRASR